MAEQNGPVLIIDDDDIDRKALERILRRLRPDIDIKDFSYAEDALDFLKSYPDEPIELILLDIKMPRMDGFEFLAAMREEFGARFNETVVMMLTTSISPRDQLRVDQEPAVRETLNKPLALTDLQAVIASELN